MEDRNTAERPTSPLGKIATELWIQRLKKGAHERYLERRAGDRAFLLEVHDYILSVIGKHHISLVFLYLPWS